MFKKAATLAPTAAPKKAKSAKRQVPLAGIEQLAMVHALAALLDTVKLTLEGEVKRAAGAIFAADIQATGRQPESFDAIEGNASANVQFKKRAGNLALSPEAVALLAANDITPHREVIVPQLYGINPARAGDEAAAAKIQAMMDSGELPSDYIVLQPEQVKHTVSDEVFAAALAKKLPPDVLAAVSSLACKPKLQQVEVPALLDYVRGLLTAPAPLPANASNDARAAA